MSLSPVMRSAAGMSCLVAILSCHTGDESLEGAFDVSDSAGVQLAVSNRPLWDNDTRWTVADEPVVEIGSTMADGEAALYQVGRVLRLGDGRIVVANGGTREGRVYSASGEHLFSFGGMGDGPGEFQSLRVIWRLPDDSIVAYDGGNSRVSVFTSEGALVRDLRLLPLGTQTQVFGVGSFKDGTILVEGLVPGDPIQPGPFAGPSRIYERRSRDGAHINSIGVLPGDRRWGMPDGMGYTQVPFTNAFGVEALGGEKVYLGDAKSSQVRVHSLEGELTRLVRWQAPRRAVTPEVISRYEEWRRDVYAEAGLPRVQGMRGREGLAYPDSMPAYQRLLVDATGSLWVEQFSAPWEEPKWWVFDEAGRWLGEPKIPQSVEVKEVGVDYLLAVRRDPLGVESVVLFGLDRRR